MSSTFLKRTTLIPNFLIFVYSFSYKTRNEYLAHLVNWEHKNKSSVIIRQQPFRNSEVVYKMAITNATVWQWNSGIQDKG